MNVVLNRPRGAAVTPRSVVYLTVLFLTLALAMPVVAQTGGQTGRITGKVIDLNTGSPIASAQVFLEDQSNGVISGIDGRYVLRNVPTGTHRLVVQMLGFGTKTITNVEVEAGGVVAIDIGLESAAVALEGITVAATIERGSTTALLRERRGMSFVADAIGAEQISRSPDGDAGAALRRVPGVSVVDGKFAYVRGLGERYSATTLNGAPLASPMPDRKVVPLDVIPSNLLESIVTAKSYAPDQPGDYAGGLVELRTKDFPTRRTLTVSASTGFNSVSTFNDGLRYPGGRFDFLGFDDGSRDLPSLIPADRRVIFPNFSRSELERIGESFGQTWGPELRNLPPNSSFGLSFGDEFELFGRSTGLLTSLTYSNAFDKKDDVLERVFASSGAETPEIDYAGDVTTRSVSLGGLFNLSYELSPTSRVTLNSVYNRLMDDESRVYEGFNLDSNANQRNFRIRFLSQEMANTQLKGEHQLGFLGSSKFDWRGTWSLARRFEPNTREVLYRQQGEDYVFENFVSSGSIFHQNLEDDALGGSAKLAIPIGNGSSGFNATLDLGGAYNAKDRTVYTRRFRFLMVPGGSVIDPSVRRLEPNTLFSKTTIDPSGFELQEATFRPDNYDATEEISAGFLKLDGQISESLGFMTGFRLERSEQVVAPYDLVEQGLNRIEPALLSTSDLLPALNLTARIGEGTNLRVGASRTLARPQLRELAPFAYADYAGGFLTVGNPQLDRSLINNFDLRWERFYGPGALLAVSGFYKTFDGPIEVAVLPSTELLKTWVNGGEAENYGVEVEFRSNLGFVSDALANLSLNTNLTLVESSVTTADSILVNIPGEGSTYLGVPPKERALQGQSPYVANVSLTWASFGGDARVTVLYNRFGRRIDAVGGERPDVYEEARSQLDVVLERGVRSGAKVKLTAKRLLGNKVEFTEGGALLRRWDTGRSVSISIGWSTGG